MFEAFVVICFLQTGCGELTGAEGVKYESREECVVGARELVGRVVKGLPSMTQRFGPLARPPQVGCRQVVVEGESA